MKIIIVCLIGILMCSSCQDTDNYDAGDSDDKMTRHDEIRRIMRSHWIHEYETGDFSWESAELRKKELSELNKMKEDYHYELSDPNINLTIPGQGWAIRGPLTIAQIEKESLEKIREYYYVTKVPLGYKNDKRNKLNIK